MKFYREVRTMQSGEKKSFWHRAGPALVLIVLAPMIAEVLPGATRMSAIFVLPIEMGYWGVGALLIRAAVRHWNLGWRNMLLLAIALCFGEELLIQQTSFAPLVIQLVKGAPYARDFGINWLYLLWAIGYEGVLVVFVPVMLAELIFPSRRETSWVSRAGLIAAAIYMAVAMFGAWFSWTQIARTKVFHLPAYTPPMDHLAGAALAVLLLIFLALGPTRRLLARPSPALAAPHPIGAGLLALVISVLWYALILLAFRIAPQVPPLPSAVAGVVIGMAGMMLYARWSAHPAWSDWHRYAVVCGAMAGTMGVGFVGFIGAAPLDIYGKAALNAVAVVLMAILALRLRRVRQSQAGPA
jgi:hypothetical protein